MVAVHEFTVPELREILRKNGQTTGGTKAELISRLTAADPTGAWLSGLSGGACNDGGGAEFSEGGDGDDVSGGVVRAGRRERGTLPVAEEAVGRREIDLYRREKELAERELELARREIEFLRNGGVAAVGAERGRRIGGASVKVNINTVAELLEEFNGDGEVYDNWEKRVELLRRTYDLDDDVMKVLIGSRLKGRASNWFHSRAEHIEMSLNDLLASLRTMFAHRSNKVVKRKTFENRAWRKGEAFGDYLHDKIILANHVPVDDSEIVDYIIEGIPDPFLRDQARVQRFESTSELLRAFERVTLRPKGQPSGMGAVQPRGGSPGQKKEERNASLNDRKCYNCGQLGHISGRCPERSKGVRCFRCNGHGHIAAKCPGERKAEAEANAVRDGSTSRFPKKKWVKSVKLAGYSIDALIDTGSDVCLIRAGQHARIGVPLSRDERTVLRGIGSAGNETLGKFSTVICVDGEQYPIAMHVIPDDLMTYDMLIGADFLNDVNLSISDGKMLISKPETKRASDSNLPEIFMIEDVRETERVDVSYVQDHKHRRDLINIISEYRPSKVRESEICMKLILKDDEPVFQRPRRLSALEKEIVNTHVNEWLEKGIIRPSLSEYASPVVLVKKRNGKTRLCVDFREINKKIVKDRYPLPLIEDQLDSLQGAKVFSTLDLENGFFHVPIDKSSQKYTAFIVPDRHYEFLKVPFGLCNSPAVFQKYVNAIFANLIALKTVLIYMDDIIIPSADCESGLRALKVVLDVARQYGLHMNWDKCRFLQSKVEYLGYEIENGTVRPSEHKTRAVVRFAEPQNVKQIQSFLGLTGYFRKFVPQYSVIARPLTNLLKLNVKFAFGEKEKEAFERLRLILSSKPLLRLYNVKAETELHTDACMYGFGAILLQRDSEDGAMHPVYYASGKTTAAEERYTSYELEVLAIIRSLRKFRVYLLGIPFKIVTDCQAFVMTMRKRDLCVRVARWALLLEEFDYTMEHRAGKRMSHVDALSRNPLPVCLLVNEDEDGLIFRLKETQKRDTELCKFLAAPEDQLPEGFLVRGDLLYKKGSDREMRLVVPRAMQSQVIRRAHENGHFAVDRTEMLLKRDFWFRGMRTKIEKVIRGCVTCILAEKKCGKQEGFLHPIGKGDSPLAVYHIDHLGPLTSTKKSYCHIFVVVDAFSKFVWLYATKTTNAAEVLDRLKKQATIFGNPSKIISDRGSAFTSHDFNDYCKEEGIQHILTTTGLPRANGQVERVNRTLIPLLTKLASPKPGEWYKYLGIAQQYLNTAHSRSIDTTPFRLLFGTHMRLKTCPEVKEMIEKELAIMFEEDRDELRRHAKENILKMQQQNRRYFNKSRKEARRYDIDQLVAIKRTQMKPGLKLAVKFLGPYRIMQIKGKDRYAVCKVGQHEGPERTITTAEYLKPWIDAGSESELDKSSDSDSL